ncbi:PH domain-containing protein [Ornithinimicrobium panacihumi]|uniref:PH domain-containing protein n=1 Tax=Ornithinimicrobium panacihumi TaxID=2008449 RepID=UPI003F8B1B72
MSTSAPATVAISRRLLDRYLLDEERPIVATRHHWAKLAEPVGTPLLGVVLAGWIEANLTAETAVLGQVVWLLWLVLVARAIWRLLEWRNEWFVATDKRLLMTYGLLTHKVAMMPLRKVTDMNYGRSLLGRLLGYGQFVLESAGQDQAMREIQWVPSPDEKYRRICATIFGPEGHDPDEDSASFDERSPFDEHIPQDPFETDFTDDQPSFADRFDADIVRIPVGGRRRTAAPPRPRWEPVERDELPEDWDWVQDEDDVDSFEDEEEFTDEEPEPVSPRARREVAVDPDPTPWGPQR